MDRSELKKLFKDKNFDQLKLKLDNFLDKAKEFDDVFFAGKLISKISTQKEKKIKVALIGGDTLYPFSYLLETFCFRLESDVEFWIGEYDNYKQEILDESSELYNFNPDVLVIVPETLSRNSFYNITSTDEEVNNEVNQRIADLFNLTGCFKKKSKANIIITNHALPYHFDIGNIRNETSGSEWSFTKTFNNELARTKPKGVEILDVEFLSCKYGLENSYDSKFYYETKNIYSPDFLVEIARELTFKIHYLKRTMKKCLVCDLDNTLWGGIIGDDGIEGIELDTVSTRGYAFKHFQKEIKKLKDRGVILAIASKNEHSIAVDAINNHPDMELREEDFVSIKANWNPKSDNIAQIAKELNIGTDSLVFIDDNPAEIEIVNQFLPEVETILLGKDPTVFVDKLKNSRFFEPKNITNEDKNKTNQYKAEAKRNSAQTSFTDFKSYLKSLDMRICIDEFKPINVARISQLTQKSNQFNLTTVRRTESEVSDLINDKKYLSLSTHIKDKFGDYGLIGVNIFAIENKNLVVDTWLMSCRVLKRQVEEEILNTVVEKARELGLEKIIGIYRPTAKNIIVKDLYKNLGFELDSETDDESQYSLIIANYKKHETQIKYD